jgi:hypothetical protein
MLPTAATLVPRIIPTKGGTPFDASLRPTEPASGKGIRCESGTVPPL